jgi:hypothetical protein
LLKTGAAFAAIIFGVLKVIALKAAADRAVRAAADRAIRAAADRTVRAAAERCYSLP